MANSLKWAWAASIAFIAVFALIPDARANSWGLGAWMGKPIYGSCAECFQESYGGVVDTQGGNCPCLLNAQTHEGTWYEVLMPVQSTGGTFTPKLYVNGSASYPITCGVDAASDNQTTINTTTQQTDISGSTALSYSITVPSGGYLWAFCAMGASSPAEWYSVTW